MDEEHDKSRNKIIEALGQIQSYDINQNSYDSDSTYFSVVDNDQVCSPILEDLLTELNIINLGKQLGVDKNDSLDTICSYCKQIYEVPNILMNPRDNTIIGPLEKCKEDLSFVQAIVWLKSIVKRMHEIPLEEYNLISNMFKQISKRNVKSRSRINDFPKLQRNCKKKIIMSNCSNISTKELNNTVSLYYSKSWKCLYDCNEQNSSQELYKEQENCTNINDTTNLSDPLTPLRWNNFCTMDINKSQNWIIPESDEELTINSENVDDTYYQENVITPDLFTIENVITPDLFNSENVITPDLFTLENDSLNNDESNISDKQEDSAYDTLNINQQDSMNFVNNIDERINNKYLQKKRQIEIIDIPRKRLKKNIKQCISTGWINFTLKSLETNDVVVKSIEMILRVFKNETIVNDYLKRKCWIDTLEKEALDAILQFANIFQLEMKSDVCSQIIVQAIQDVLKEICQKTNFNKNIINKIHLILYALSICLRKYKMIILSNKNDTERNIIIPVTKLWRKQWNIDHVSNENNTKAQMSIEKWINSLELFTRNHIYDIPLLAEKTRQLHLMLIT
ncbi:PREDICTED: uncharacterized protein LOC107068274 [Polistes dominula]|uniref:Uncharacterized protein LOC107068274 n=1 Tax=Polistes dominula TaxID=743375 RepID=A0ABM1IIE4_POLDO|nr:PREDICTED: uncharacterized protein LOC107068274 [Polistes dominula]